MPKPSRLLAAWRYNRQILLGECGALLLASLSASLIGKFTTRPGLISASAVAATLLGGALFWLAARIYDKTREHKIAVADLTTDISYFTPAAIVLGLVVYDPSIYLASHHLLTRGDAVAYSVLAGQAIAFALFLGCMNLYRILLRRPQRN